MAINVFDIFLFSAFRLVHKIFVYTLFQLTVDHCDGIFAHAIISEAIVIKILLHNAF